MFSKVVHSVQVYLTAQCEVSATVSSMEEGGVQEPVVDHSGGITAQYDVSAIVAD